jgi:hypothetical protein
LSRTAGPLPAYPTQIKNGDVDNRVGSRSTRLNGFGLAGAARAARARSSKRVVTVALHFASAPLHFIFVRSTVHVTPCTKMIYGATGPVVEPGWFVKLVGL